mgnify:CR=1 FL=1
MMIYWNFAQFDIMYGKITERRWKIVATDTRFVSMKFRLKFFGMYEKNKDEIETFWFLLAKEASSKVKFILHLVEFIDIFNTYIPFLFFTNWNEREKKMSCHDVLRLLSVSQIHKLNYAPQLNSNEELLIKIFYLQNGYTYISIALWGTISCLIMQQQPRAGSAGAKNN